MKRREFLIKSAAASAALPLFISCGRKPRGKKLLVLGIDGLDPAVANRLMEAGQMPNLQKLAQRGSFTMMRSTVPPQSPVAWGSFITGADPGVHGIFDFVHRDPQTYFPKFSLSEHLEPRWVVKLGKYDLPLKPGRMVLQRRGKAFWENLEEHGIGATIFKVPSNFPPSASGQRTLAGMGTPDLVGGNGIFTLFTSDEAEFQRDLSPHRVYYADISENGVMPGILEGPPNSLTSDAEPVVVPFTVYVDGRHRTVAIDIQERRVLLAEKEYSPWVPVKFPMISGLQSVHGMVRFYLLEMGDRFRLYISPVQIDPSAPAMTISTPDDYCRRLAAQNGRFHTLGLPADFNAVKLGVLDIEQYIHQSQSVFDESERLYRAELSRFLSGNEGLLFFYFSSLDQGQHIFWVLNDPSHPFYRPEWNQRYGRITADLYRRCDRILGETMKRLPPETGLMLISDHGFAPFRRKVNLNNWLLQEGYLQLRPGETTAAALLAGAAAWDRSRAYGIGLNGLYLNERGREAEGIVPPAGRRKLLEELQSRLEALTDPESGGRVISRAYIAEDVYSRDCLGHAPDIVIGFERGYRSDDRFGEGGLSPQIFSENLSWWSGDHCIDPLKVPATFAANFPIQKPVPHMTDLAPTILSYLGVPAGRQMKGKSLI